MGGREGERGGAVSAMILATNAAPCAKMLAGAGALGYLVQGAGSGRSAVW